MTDGSDRVALHVALWNLAQSLGLNWTTVDASRSDVDLVAEIQGAVKPALARAFSAGAARVLGNQGMGAQGRGHMGANPYDGSSL